jgi:hypothetical protein
MKLLSIFVLVLGLALLLPPVWGGVRQRVHNCSHAHRLAPVRVIRSRQAAQTPKTVRAVKHAPAK